MTRSPAHWEKPDSSKGQSTTREDDLTVGKPDVKVPRDGDWVKQVKNTGAGFSGNAQAVYHYSTNPGAGPDRSPPEHKYRVTDSGEGSGASRMETQNRLASKRK